MGAFTVSVGGKDYDVDAPDETTAWKWAKATHLKGIASEGQQVKPPTPFRSSGDTALSGGEQFLANPYGRAAVGAVKPIVGIGQFGLNLIGQGEGINQQMSNLRQTTDKAREYVGSTGIDLADAVGQTASMAIPTTMMGNTASTIGRVGQGMLVGAGSGAATPVDDADNFWRNKIAQIGVGTGAGGIAPAAWEGVKAVGRGARNVAQPYMGDWGADQSAGRLANAAAGDKADDIINLLRNPQTIVPGSAPTSGQVAVPANRAEFNALQELAAARKPSEYRGPLGIEGQQNAARLAAMNSIGGSPLEIEAAMTQRAAATKPMRETALENANVAGVKGPQLEQRLQQQQGSVVNALQDTGRFQTTAAQMENRGNNFFPVEGMPRVSGKYSVFPERVAEAENAAADTARILQTRKAQKGLTQYQLDSLSAHGYYPLEGNAVSKRIEATMTQPGLRASDVVQKTLGDIKEKISSLTNEKGVIDSKDLYTIRKEIGNTIDKYSKETSNWDKRLTSGLERNVQRFIDDAIEGAGGSGWKDYLAQYAGMSKRIDQMKMGDELTKKLISPLSDESKQRAGVFAGALRDSGPDLQRTMNPAQLRTLGNVRDDLARDATHTDLARAGNKKAMEITGQAVPEAPPTGMFSPLISVARGTYNRLSGKATDKIMDDLATIMQNPRRLAEVMEKAKPFEREIILDQLLRAQSAGASNMLNGALSTQMPRRGALSE